MPQGDKTNSIANGPDAQLVSLVVVREQGALKFALGWKSARYTEDEQYQIARVIDQIMRNHAPAWGQAARAVDEHYRKGKQLARAPKFIQRIVARY